jgi:hypothetical protein
MTENWPSPRDSGSTSFAPPCWWEEEDNPPKAAAASITSKGCLLGAVLLAAEAAAVGTEGTRNVRQWTGGMALWLHKDSPRCLVLVERPVSDVENAPGVIDKREMSVLGWLCYHSRELPDSLTGWLDPMKVFHADTRLKQA